MSKSAKYVTWKPEYVKMLIFLKYVKKYAITFSHFFSVSNDYDGYGDNVGVGPEAVAQR